MMSQKGADPQRDSNKHGPFLQEFASVLFENKQFAISSVCTFDIFRSILVSKFEKDPGKYNVDTNQNISLSTKTYQGLKQSGL